MLKSKSGLNVWHGITSDGVIDEGYTGSIMVKLCNHGDKPYKIERGDKITQLVVVPCEYVDSGRQLGISFKAISNVCRGKSKTSGGYHWEYVEEPR